MAVTTTAGAQNERSSRSSRGNNEARRDAPSSARSERTYQRVQTTTVRTEQPSSRNESSNRRSATERRESSSSRSYNSGNSTPQPESSAPQVRTVETRSVTTRSYTPSESRSNEGSSYERRPSNGRPDRNVPTTARTVQVRSYDNNNGRTYERRYDYSTRSDRGNSYRYEGRYNGRWDNTYTEKYKVHGYGKPRYVVYQKTRIYRAPCYTGVIRVRPPRYQNMPVVACHDHYHVARPVSQYRPYWASSYDFVRRWVFFPRLNIYWDNYSNMFVYLHHNRWTVSNRLPRVFVSVDLLSEPLFEVEEDYDSEDGYFDDGYYYNED